MIKKTKIVEFVFFFVLVCFEENRKEGKGGISYLGMMIPGPPTSLK
jgi:hypothetical protein